MLGIFLIRIEEHSDQLLEYYRNIIAIEIGSDLQCPTPELNIVLRLGW